MATATPTPVRPQSPGNSVEELLRERDALLQYERIGLCGRFTSVFTRNLPLIVLLAVTLIASLAYFPALVDTLTGSQCQMHHDRFLGKLWLECPEKLARAFGPRQWQM